MKLFPDTVSIFFFFFYEKRGKEEKRKTTFLLYASGESLSTVVVP